MLESELKPFWKSSARSETIELVQFRNWNSHEQPELLFAFLILFSPRTYWSSGVNALLVVLPFQLCPIRAVQKIRTNWSRIRNKLISVLEKLSIGTSEVPETQHKSPQSNWNFFGIRDKELHFISTKTQEARTSIIIWKQLYTSYIQRVKNAFYIH